MNIAIRSAVAVAVGVVLAASALSLHAGTRLHVQQPQAAAADGNTALAIQAYERSLQLNPANTGGAEALKKLRGAAGRDSR